MSMTLPEYIDSIGIDEFSKRYNVKPRTALAYKYRDRYPRRELAKRLTEELKLDWIAIYGD